MLRQNRHLESDIKISLTGSREGTCAEHPAYVCPTYVAPTASQAITASPEDEEDLDVCSEGEDSDTDQVTF